MKVKNGLRLNHLFYEILGFYFLTCNGAISYIRTPSIVADKNFFDQFSLLGSSYSPFVSYLIPPESVLVITGKTVDNYGHR